MKYYHYIQPKVNERLKERIRFEELCEARTMSNSYVDADGNLKLQGE